MRKASALLLTILIVGVISIAVFGISRLTITSLKITTSGTDSDIAFFAARAGLEHALFKLRQVDSPDGFSQYDTRIQGYLFRTAASWKRAPSLASEDESYKRFFLEQNPGFENQTDKENVDPYAATWMGTLVNKSGAKNSIFYDLNISQIKKYIGCDTNDDKIIDQNDFKFRDYNCDSGYKSKSSGKDLYCLGEGEISPGFFVFKSEISKEYKYPSIWLYWSSEAKGLGGTLNSDEGLEVEVRGYKQGAIQPNEIKIARTFYNIDQLLGGINSTTPMPSCTANWPDGVNKIVICSVEGNGILQNQEIKNVFSGVAGADVDANMIRIYLRPRNVGTKKICFGIQPNPDNDPKIEGPIIHIDSIGYFHGIKRKLWAEIDKRSGDLKSAFDYAIFGGTSVSK